MGARGSDLTGFPRGSSTGPARDRSFRRSGGRSDAAPQSVHGSLPRALVSVCGCSSVLGPRASLGPGAIVRGRGLYNEVITATNNEQTLELIVRARYGEPAGLLSVASVTANLRATASTAAQFGIGPSSNYNGNLVPLALGFAYEENPTIAYTTVQGERYAKAMLSPVGLDMLVLLAGSEQTSARSLRRWSSK